MGQEEEREDSQALSWCGVWACLPLYPPRVLGALSTFPLWDMLAYSSLTFLLSISQGHTPAPRSGSPPELRVAPPPLDSSSTDRGLL